MVGQLRMNPSIHLDWQIDYKAMFIDHSVLPVELSCYFICPVWCQMTVGQSTAEGNEACVRVILQYTGSSLNFSWPIISRQIVTEAQFDM